MKYEYRIAASNEPLSAKQLNEFGAEGWELVDIVHHNLNSKFYHYLKREIRT
jgi:hypothetical protein